MTTVLQCKCTPIVPLRGHFKGALVVRSDTDSDTDTLLARSRLYCSVKSGQQLSVIAREKATPTRRAPLAFPFHHKKRHTSISHPGRRHTFRSSSLVPMVYPPPCERSVLLCTMAAQQQQQQFTICALARCLAVFLFSQIPPRIFAEP